MPEKKHAANFTRGELIRFWLYAAAGLTVLMSLAFVHVVPLQLDLGALTAGEAWSLGLAYLVGVPLAATLLVRSAKSFDPDAKGSDFIATVLVLTAVAIAPAMVIWATWTNAADRIVADEIHDRYGLTPQDFPDGMPQSHDAAVTLRIGGAEVDCRTGEKRTVILCPDEGTAPAYRELKAR